MDTNVALPEGHVVGAADPGDIDEMLALQEANLPSSGGLLSVRLPPEWFRDGVAQGFITVARSHGRVVGYAAGTPLSWQTHIPIIQALMQNFEVPPDSYVYGPACVADTERGRGLAQEMFRATHARMGGRPCRTFVRDDNVVSRRAHIKVGLKEIGAFHSGGADYIAIAFD